MGLDHSCQVQRHSFAERGHDLYETPDVAVEALLRVERLPHGIWEPAAGKGAIVRVLREHGHDVIATDLIDYKFPLHAVSDFLKTTEMPAGCEAILTNPPYRWAEEFVARALDLSPLVVMLLRLAFMESERRCTILEGRGLARVHVFRKRLPMMHRDQWAGKKGNSGMAFAWFVFDRNHAGPATISRISWERPENDQPSVGGLRRNHEEEADMADEAKKLKLEVVPDEELDADEAEFRKLRRDLPGVRGASAAGIVSISVGKIPGVNEFFRTNFDFRPVVPIVSLEVGMEKQSFAVDDSMVEALASIGITVASHTLYLTTTPTGAVKIIPVNCESDNDYNRTKELGLLQGIKEWVRLYTDQKNKVYKVFPAPAGRFADPIWPELKHAKIFRLAFRDRGRLVDSPDHPLFQKWAARDRG